MSKLFFYSLDHWPVFRILHRPCRHIEIFSGEHVKKFGLLGKFEFTEILYLLVQTDFLLKDRLRCSRPFELDNEIEKVNLSLRFNKNNCYNGCYEENYRITCYAQEERIGWITAL